MKCIHCGMEFETGNFCPNCGAKMNGNSPDQIIGLKENPERSFQLNDQMAGDEQRKGDDIPQRETRSASLNDAAIADADRKAQLCLTLGIIALATSCTILGPLGCGIASIVMGRIALKNQTRSKAKVHVGTMLSGASIVLVMVIGLIGVAVAIDSGTQKLNQSTESQVELSSEGTDERTSEGSDTSDLVRTDDTVTDNTESEQETDSTEPDGTVDVGEDTSVSDTTVTEAPVIKELQYGIYLIRDEDGGYRIARVFPAEDNAIAVIYIDQVSAGDRFVTYFTATIPYSDSGIYSAYDSSFNTTASIRFTDLGMDFAVESADAPEQEFLSGEYEAVSLLESPYGYDTPSIGLYECSTDGGSNMADLGLYSGLPSDDGIGYLRITCTNADGQAIAYFDGHLYDNQDGTYNVYSTVDNDDTKLLVEFHGERMVVTVLWMGMLRYEEIAGEYELNYGYMAP